jgi:hypothetical protein
MVVPDFPALLGRPVILFLGFDEETIGDLALD